MSEDNWLDAEEFNSNNAKRYETIESKSERQNNIRDMKLLNPSRTKGRKY